MSALRSPPLRLPARQLILGPAPSFTTQGEKKARQWGQLALAILAGALLILFVSSLFEDIQQAGASVSAEELFEDSRF
jgi:hypothetical protein